MAPNDARMLFTESMAESMVVIADCAPVAFDRSTEVVSTPRFEAVRSPSSIVTREFDDACKAKWNNGKGSLFCTSKAAGVKLAREWSAVVGKLKPKVTNVGVTYGITKNHCDNLADVQAKVRIRMRRIRAAFGQM